MSLVDDDMDQVYVVHDAYRTNKDEPVTVALGRRGDHYFEKRGAYWTASFPEWYTREILRLAKKVEILERDGYA